MLPQEGGGSECCVCGTKEGKKTLKALLRPGFLLLSCTKSTPDWERRTMSHAGEPAIPSPERERERERERGRQNESEREIERERE